MRAPKCRVSSGNGRLVREGNQLGAPRLEDLHDSCLEDGRVSGLFRRENTTTPLMRNASTVVINGTTSRRPSGGARAFASAARGRAPPAAAASAAELRDRVELTQPSPAALRSSRHRAPPRSPGRELADDLALVHDEDAVGQGQHLLELERDQQHRLVLRRAPRPAAVDELDGADVEAPRRLRGDEDARVAVDLAGQDDLLLVAARDARPGGLGPPPRTSNSLISRRPLDEPAGKEPAEAGVGRLCGTRGAPCSRRSRSRGRVRGAAGPREHARHRCRSDGGRWRS